MTPGEALFLIIAVALYFIPAMVAYRRDVLNKVTIAQLNFWLGWTVIGWWAALIMAVAPAPAHRKENSE